MASTHPHSRRFHAVVRVLFNSGITIALLGFVFIVTGLAEPVVGAALGFIGTMIGYFSGWCLVCDKTCTSD